MIRKSLLQLIILIIAAILPAAATCANDKPEDAPIVEQRIAFYDFTMNAADGRPFNLRDYTKGKRLITVAFVAGWCPNSNRNGHVIKRLYDKFRDRGLGAVVVTEYSDDDEVTIHVNRIGIDYPVVVETNKRDARKKSLHYKYRQAAGDRRKWGTPFYVIIDARDIEEAGPNAPLTRRVYTVSGEMVESEAERFIEEHLRLQRP